MSSRKIISKRRTKKGETILTLDLELIGKWMFKNFLKYFLKPKRYQLLAIAGLGLGVGLSFMFFFSPAQVQANLPTLQSVGLEISRIKSTDLGIDTSVVSGVAKTLPFVHLDAPAVHLESSAGIGGGRPIVIQGVNQDYGLQNLSQAQLGDEIFIIGSNQGWYRYRVVETKFIPLEKLNAEILQLKEVAILYTVNSWQKKASVVIARPQL